jgi:hypothetical protein
MRRLSLLTFVFLLLLTHLASAIDLNARTADTTAGARAPSPSPTTTTNIGSNTGNNNSPPFFLPFLIAFLVLGPLCVLWYVWRWSTRRRTGSQTPTDGARARARGAVEREESVAMRTAASGEVGNDFVVWSVAEGGVGARWEGRRARGSGQRARGAGDEEEKMGGDIRLPQFWEVEIPPVAATALWLTGKVRSIRSLGLLCLIGFALDAAPRASSRPFPCRPNERFNPDNTRHARVPGRMSRPHARCDPRPRGHTIAPEVVQPLIHVFMCFFVSLCMYLSVAKVDGGDVGRSFGSSTSPIYATRVAQVNGISTQATLWIRNATVRSQCRWLPIVDVAFGSARAVSTRPNARRTAKRLSK